MACVCGVCCRRAHGRAMPHASWARKQRLRSAGSPACSCFVSSRDHGRQSRHRAQPRTGDGIPSCGTRRHRVGGCRIRRRPQERPRSWQSAPLLHAAPEVPWHKPAQDGVAQCTPTAQHAEHNADSDVTVWSTCSGASRASWPLTQATEPEWTTQGPVGTPLGPPFTGGQSQWPGWSGPCWHKELNRRGVNLGWSLHSDAVCCRRSGSVAPRCAGKTVSFWVSRLGFRVPWRVRTPDGPAPGPQRLPDWAVPTGG